MQKQPQTLRKSEANLPLVAIVGRTNVGKSSLFNRIAGRQLAIVQPEHGTTVDRIGTTIRHKSGSFRLMDTGGFSFEKEVLFRNEINREVEKAIHDAKIILFVCDGKGGIHPQDELFAQKLRTRKKQVIVVVNKLDHHELYSDADQFYKLGYDQLIKISTAQGQGIAELVDTIARKLPEGASSTQVEYDFSLCIAGEPNCGKSTYFNALLNEERAIVSEIPGTTRDVVSEIIEYQNKKILINDTAGFRTSRSYEDAIHQFSIAKTKKAIRTSEIVMLLCDGYRGFGRTSKQIADFILEAQKSCIVVINKWDLVKRIEQSKYRERFERHVPFLAGFPFIFISAQSKRNLLAPLDAALEINDSYKHHLKTNELNKLLIHIKKKNVLHGSAKLKYLTQIGTAPPRFLLFGKRLDQIKASEIQYIKNSIGEAFGMAGVPIQLSLREETS